MPNTFGIYTWLAAYISPEKGNLETIKEVMPWQNVTDNQTEFNILNNTMLESLVLIQGVS